MSNVSTIQAHIESVLESSLTGAKKSRHFYDFNKNDDVKNSYIYAVRPMSASATTGTLRSATIRQEFEIEIAREYQETGSNDEPLRSAILSLHNDNELVLASLLSSRPLGTILIEVPSISEPQIDDRRKSVSLIFTYPITYRKELPGSL